MSKIASFWKPPTVSAKTKNNTNGFTFGIPPLPFEIPPLQNQAVQQPVQHQSQSSTVNIRTHRLSAMMEKYPFSWITGGRFESSDIAAVGAMQGPRHWTEQALKQNSIMERNYALAATTPVLGQYAPTYETR